MERWLARVWWQHRNPICRPMIIFIYSLFVIVFCIYYLFSSIYYLKLFAYLWIILEWLFYDRNQIRQQIIIYLSFFVIVSIYYVYDLYPSIFIQYISLFIHLWISLERWIRDRNPIGRPIIILSPASTSYFLLSNYNHYYS